MKRTHLLVIAFLAIPSVCFCSTPLISCNMNAEYQKAKRRQDMKLYSRLLSESPSLGNRSRGCGPKCTYQYSIPTFFPISGFLSVLLKHPSRAPLLKAPRFALGETAPSYQKEIATHEPLCAIVGTSVYCLFGPCLLGIGLRRQSHKIRSQMHSPCQSGQCLIAKEKGGAEVV